MKKRYVNIFRVIGAVVLMFALVVPSFTSTTLKFGTDSDGNMFAYGGQGYISTSYGSQLFPVTGAGLQDAIDYLVSGGTVYLPEGTISCTSAINVENNTEIVGCDTVLNLGISSGIHIFNASNVTIKNIRVYGAGGIITVKADNANVENFIFEDIYISPVGITPGDVDYQGAFLIRPGNDGTIDNMRFVNCIVNDSDTHGFSFHAWPEGDTGNMISNVTLENCKAISCGVETTRYNDYVCGFVFSHDTSMENVFVHNCLASYNWESGFHIEDKDVTSSFVYDSCIATDNGQDDAPDHGVGIQVCGDVIASNCVVKNNRVGVRIYNNGSLFNSEIDNCVTTGISISGSNNSRIIGNYVNNCDSYLVYGDYMEHGVISGNVFENSAQGIYNPGYCHNCTFVDNQFYNIDDGPGIDINGNNNRVGGNLFYNVDDNAFYAIYERGTNSVIVGNELINCQKSIWLAGTDVSVNDNTIVNSGTYAIYVNGANGIINGNYVNSTSNEVGIYVAGSDVIVSSNYVASTAKECIKTISGQRDIIIQDNLIYYSGQEGIEVNSNDTLVCGNLVKFSNYEGIKINNDNCTVNDNIVLDNGRSSNDYGIRVLSGKNCSVVGNRIRGAVVGIYLHANSEDINVIGNTVSGNVNAGIGNYGSNNYISGNVGGLNSTNRDETLELIRNSNGKCWAASGPNIETAITNAGDGGWIETPAGKISISSDIDISGISNFTWHGYGTELEVSDSSSFDGGGLISIVNCDNLIIEGLELDGNHPWNTSASDAYAGINIRSMNFSTIRDCEIHHVLGDGIVFQDATGETLYDENSCNNLITNNYIHHIGDVYDNTSSGDAGIRLMGSSLMNNNTFSYNTIDMIREHGIKIYGYTIISEVYYYDMHNYNKIIGNIISNTNMGAWGTEEALYGRGISIGGKFNTVNDNKIFYNVEMEIAIIVGNGEKSIINGNTIEVDEQPRSMMVGIELVNSSYSIVSENIIDINSRTDSYGIYIQDCDVTKIVDNTINDFDTHGIYVSDTNECNFLDISHNQMSRHTANAGWGIALYNLEYSTIAFNTILDTYYGMTSDTDCDYNIYIGNNAQDCTDGWDMATETNSVNSTNLPAFS